MENENEIDIPFNNNKLNCIIFGINISYIVIGITNTCNIHESRFLVIFGVLCILSVILSYYLNNVTHDDGSLNIYNTIIYYILICIHIAQLCAAIYGIMLVWPFNLHPCSNILYGFAFMAVILWWFMAIYILIILCYDNNNIEDEANVDNV